MIGPIEFELWSGWPMVGPIEFELFSGWPMIGPIEFEIPLFNIVVQVQREIKHKVTSNFEIEPRP